MNIPKRLTTRIANRLFLLRSERNLSLAAVAKQSGVSRATLSRIENAEVSPTAETLNALCIAFELPLSHLIAMTEDRFAPLIQFEDQTEMTDRKTGLTSRNISPPSPDLLAWVEEGHLPPGRTLEISQDGKQGQEIHLILLDGALTISVDQTDHDLTAGDCLRYKNYSSARFETQPTRGARFLRICV